ncbi:hypothetical protein LOTGIDRAFT_214105 [Lottia gigantea]|uniref:Voltage-gated hydrogen channel 1 n=1 Tax=Lottia gigantea TaxID=225164 RepID=V4C6I8_LOTGI|nr:hypothetical protein LOTGIDRAFT_214105 [Lottia gigantea]ESO97279.1 hypothetical protein LOTGIDRAFT_214105 [Lottia gigantea]
MEDFHAIQDNLEKAIEKDETAKTAEASKGKQPQPVKPDQTIRERLRGIIESHNFHIGVVVLVIIDALLVISELLIDLDIVKLENKEHHVAPKVLHGFSIFILSIFMVEISIRIYVLRLEFFKRKLEVFDALVVIVSFILDIVFINSEGTKSGVGLLVILRLWRVTRILNGIVMSVKAQAQMKIDKEIENREACEKENLKLKQENTDQTKEIARLKELLDQNGVKYS